MNAWFAGSDLTAEVVRYICNFMCVSRLRPSEAHDEADGNSEDLVSAEELSLSQGELVEALQTRIGGKRPEVDDSGNDDVDVPDHCHNSKSAMARAHSVWRSVAQEAEMEAHRFRALPKDVETVIKAARDSQKNDPWHGGYKKEVVAPKSPNRHCRPMPTLEIGWAARELLSTPNSSK